ncbi:hypothetical protein [Pontibacter indicus]|uniref:TerB family tellurite resistance protein n=1 Tax=Pontibacter indicus TaxID=1317125 RepID=A0A1R3XVT4_9BACT|nr:hypothetical protein [Pontibacter indicus]SIT95222.1 hypothetical protein SAMN05444128_3970 [Pontibacter indicus]
MKARILLIFLLATLSLPARAQTLNEWLRQKQTQKDYLVQQIAALRAYAGTLRQGYQVLDRGISTVQHSKNGDLGLHRVFFHSLQQISPAIGESAQLADILGWQQAIHRDLASLWARLPAQDLLPGELDYLENIRRQVLQACDRDLESLRLLLTSHLLQVSDAEGLRQLAQCHRATQERYQFTQYLIGETQTLLVLRHRARQDLHALGSLYQLPFPSQP